MFECEVNVGGESSASCRQKLSTSERERRVGVSVRREGERFRSLCSAVRLVAFALLDFVGTTFVCASDNAVEIRP